MRVSSPWKRAGKILPIQLGFGLAKSWARSKNTTYLYENCLLRVSPNHPLDQPWPLHGSRCPEPRPPLGATPAFTRKDLERALQEFDTGEADRRHCPMGTGPEWPGSP